MNMNKYIRFLIDSGFRLNVLTHRNFLKWVPDQIIIEKKYLYAFRKKLNLENPASYTEKLQWLKLYDRRPEYTEMTDKYLVKKMIAEKIGSEYIIPTLGIWEQFEDIDFDALPDSFVLKCTHDCGSVILCRDKKTLDIPAARKKLSAAMKRNYYWGEREWPYKNIKPQIIAEKYMADSDVKGLRDYKFFCFNGNVRAMFVASDRFSADTDVKFDFFDENFNHLPIRNGHDNAVVPPERPVCFEKMKELATILSEGIPHVRVDLYEVDGKVYFGEMTFFHFGGFVPFEPEEWDKIFGSWLFLPEKQSSLKHR